VTGVQTCALPICQNFGNVKFGTYVRLIEHIFAMGTPHNRRLSKMNYLHEYKTFNSVQELNHHVKEHTNKRYYDMNETQRQVLQLISQYSVKHIGASHLRIKTIANS